MTAGNRLNLTHSKASRALKGAEWMAENAYIAPGFHRLLTAGGLTAGLWGGRKLMDVITARSAADNTELTIDRTPEIIRPLHGLMRYNAYSDAPVDRWKFVADRFVPVVLGAVGAYYGGKLFFHGKMPSGEAFSAGSAAAKKAWGDGKIATDVTDTMLGIVQSDATRKLGAVTFSEGSAAGQHLPGALWPFNNGLIAVSFQLGARRSTLIPGMSWLNRKLGNYGASSRFLHAAMRDTAKWMEANINQFNSPKEWVTHEALLNRARDGLQKFPHRSAADEKKLVDEFRRLIDETYHYKAGLPDRLSPAKRSESIYQFISGNAKGRSKRGLLGSAYDHLLHSAGFDLSKAKLAHGPWALFSRLFGSRPRELKIMESYAQYLNKELGYSIADTTKWAEEQIKVEPWKRTAAYSGAVAAIGAGLWGAGVAAHRIHKESSHTHKPHIHTPDQPVVDADNSATTKQPQSYSTSWVNGKPLDVAHWLSRVLITPPSMHRFMNAAYLSAVLYGGMKFANVLTGRKLPKVMSAALTKDGIPESVMHIKDVWAPFKPLHGLLAYTPGSAAITDRWRQAAHYIIPVGVGMFGTYTGSYMYFSERQKSLATPQTLEDFADRISFEQSKVYAGATAITSIFNTGSGIHLLPIFNYSSNLHNRYLMGSGQQIAMPGIGKWWSGNAGTTPWGVKRSLQHMTNYLTHNSAARPRELPQLVHSVIGKLYPDLTEPELLDKKQIMLDRIYDVRDSYLINGAVPLTKREALGKAMSKLLAGAGFEALLREADLDPMKADLANNGASGTIANALGKHSTVSKLSQEYRTQLAQRNAQPTLQKSTDFLRTLIDKGEPANDPSFTSRLKAGLKPAPAQAI